MVESKNNTVNIVGKLVSMTVRNGMTKAGKAYESARIVVRVDHTYSGKEEVSEIEAEFFASPYTSKMAPNPAYEQLQSFKKCKSIQEVGYEDADIVRIPCELAENMYFSDKRARVVSDWRLRTSFPTRTDKNAPENASFSVDAYIFDMKDEYDRDGDPTGRVIIKGGVMGYGKVLNMMDFVVEKPEYVHFVKSNWNVNDTVRIDGKVRVTTTAVSTPKNSGWGEETSVSAGRVFVKELIVVNGSESAYEEGFDEDIIREAFNNRKAKMDALSNFDKVVETKKTVDKKANKYDWLE